jgi:hypothetical protein
MKIRIEIEVMALFTLIISIKQSSFLYQIFFKFPMYQTIQYLNSAYGFGTTRAQNAGIFQQKMPFLEAAQQVKMNNCF